VSSPRPAGRTPCRPVPCRGAGRAFLSVRVSLTRARSGSPRCRRSRSSRSRGSAGRRVATRRAHCGACADSSTCWSAASASAEAAAIHDTWSAATRSISGAWRPSSRAACSGLPPRCGSLAGRGSSSRSNRTVQDRSSGRPPCSIPSGPGSRLLVRALSLPPARVQRPAARHRASGPTRDGIAM
jgi:hypothetical protein